MSPKIQSQIAAMKYLSKVRPNQFRMVYQEMNLILKEKVGTDRYSFWWPSYKLRSPGK